MNLKAGDVVIRRKAGTSITSVATVRDDGVLPMVWRIGTLAEAQAWATKTIATTKGTVHETDQRGRPFSK